MTIAVEKTTQEIKRILILGGGITGWTVAAGLSHGLRGLNIEMVLLDDANNLEVSSSCESTLPATNTFHNILGINEQHLVAATGASYILATHYQGWANNQQNYFMPFTEHGFMLNRIEFQHYMINAHLQGQSIKYDDYALSAVAARYGKFRHPSTQSTSLYSGLVYGLQLNCKEYGQYMQHLAMHVGVKHIIAEVSSVEINKQNGNLQAITVTKNVGLTDPLVIAPDGKINADLFIDCSGLNGRLIDESMEVKFNSANDVLHATHSVSSVTAAQHSIPTSSLLRQSDAGWQYQITTKNYSENECFFNHNFITDEQVIKPLGLTGNDESNLVFRNIRSGRRKNFWVKNCIAIGDAAASLENFTVGKLHIVQSAVLRLLALFPSHEDVTYNAAEYNRLTHLECDHIQDFHALHYLLGRNLKTPFWQMANSSPMSDRLSYKLELFKQRGIIPFYEGETLSAGIWISLLLGQEMWPLRCDPLIDGMPDIWIQQQLQKMKQLINEAAIAMPKHDDYLNHHISLQR